MKEEALIFLVSQPRSGSTYLQRLLSNNDSVNTVSEPWILLAFANQFNPRIVKSAVNNRLTVKAFSEYLEAHPTLDFNDKFQKFLLSLYAPMLANNKYVLDKTPRYWEILDEIVTTFPNSKIILLKRNPLDVVTSMVRTWNLQSFNMLNNYRRDILLAPKAIQKFENENSNNPNVISITYENLIANKNNVVHALYNWLGIEFNEEALDISDNRKHEGKFGDPYQNDTNSTQSSIDSEAFLKDTRFESFLEGYCHYLGQEYFMQNSFEKNFREGNKTKEFLAFMELPSDFADTDENSQQVFQIYHENKRLRSEIETVRKSTTYKLGNWILRPFRFLK